MRKLFNFIAFFVFIAGALMGFLFLTEAPDFDPVDIPPVDAPVVSIEQVELAPYLIKIDVMGTVEALQAGDIQAEVSGKILSIDDNFAVGGRVRAGEILATIDPSAYESAIVQASSSLDSAQSVLDQEKARAAVAQAELVRQGRSVEANPLAARVPQLKAAESSVALARSQLQTAQDQLGKTTIAVPFDSEIIAKTIVLGQQVGAGSPVAKVVSTQSKRIKIQVTNEQMALLDQFKRDASVQILGLITIGQTDVRTVSIPISQIANTVDSASQLTTLYIDVKAEALGQEIVDDIPVGQRIALQLSVAESRDFIALPIAAIGQGNRVRILDTLEDRDIKSAAVEPIWWGEDRVVIRSGLEEGDVIVSTPVAATILDGTRIRLEGDPVAVMSKDDDGMPSDATAKP